MATIYDFMGRLGEFDYVLDGKKVLAQQEQAQKLQEAAGGAGMALRGQQDVRVVPVTQPAAAQPPKPAAANATKKQ